MKRWVIVETHKNRTKTIVSELTECGDYEILFNDKQRTIDVSNRLSKIRTDNKFKVVELKI